MNEPIKMSCREFLVKLLSGEIICAEYCNHGDTPVLISKRVWNHNGKIMELHDGTEPKWTEISALPHPSHELEVTILEAPKFYGTDLRDAMSTMMVGDNYESEDGETLGLELEDGYYNYFLIDKNHKGITIEPKHFNQKWRKT